MGALKIFTSRKQTMKHTIFLKLAAVALLVAVVATGCKKTPKNVTPIHGRATQVGGTGTGGTPINPDTALNPPLVGIPPGGRATTPPPPITDSFPPVVPSVPDVPRDLRPIDEIINGRAADRLAFAANTIHFDYDKAVVKQSEAGKLQPVIAALKSAPQNNLQVEGHCDERGTEEYNRALGERRALAIRDFLIKNGKISPDRITTTSFGEDKPAELGHTESAWAKNRRGELVLLKPKN